MGVMRPTRRGIALAAALVACGLAAPAAAPARAVDVTVMTFNIASAVETDNDLGPIAAAIRGAHPGIVGLQELDRSWSRSDGVDQPADLARRLGMHWSFDANLDCAALDFD